MKVFVMVVVMWWSNPADRPYNDSVEINSLEGKPFYFETRGKCFEYIEENLEGLKQFGRITFPTADAVEKILCAPKIQKET